MSVTTGLQLPFGIQPVNPVPVDAWSGPFTGSIDTVDSARESANSSIPSAIRFKSMEVRLIVSGTARKFWYRDGIADADLVEFSSGTTTTNPGGASGTVQFNDGGVFGGIPNFIFDKSTNTLKVDNVSGSLTKLSDGSDYLIAGRGIHLTTGSNGSITIESNVTGSGTNVSAGLGLVAVDTSGSLKLVVDDSIVATLTGSIFSGRVIFNAGLSGSLTSLQDGSPYLVAGSGISISTGSTGQITIASSTSPAPSTSDFIVYTRWMEVPSGETDGMNMLYTLESVPTPISSLMLYVNGVLQLGEGIDYFVNGKDVVLNYAPILGSNILATYNYEITLPKGPVIKWLERPTGEADGVNLDFTLSNAPDPVNSLMFYVNGILQKQGLTSDYTVSDKTVMMNYYIPSGSNIAATYAYKIKLPVVGKDIMWSENPVGEIDGLNYEFTISKTPLPQDSLMFYVNGVLQRQGSLYDYTFTDDIITMNYIPYSGSNIAATYPYDKSLTTGDRPKYYANVLSYVPSNTNVSFLDGNLDESLPDMSSNNFLNDYDLYVNGSLLRPGASYFSVNDYYPGNDLTTGQIKFKFDLNEGDLLCLIPVISN